jgi:hypothetical protein
MNVSAIIVTRGDVDLRPVLDSLPDEWERVVWDNSGRGPLTDKLAREFYATTSRAERRRMNFKGGPHRLLPRLVFAQPDLSVYGRYAAIEYASHDLIFTQDDDVIVSDPQAIVNEWVAHCTWKATSDESVPVLGYRSERLDGQHLVANMPPQFRHDGYTDSCLVGFGACFHRDAPTRAFRWFSGDEHHEYFQGWFRRTCDVVFTTLTPRVLVDVPKQNLPYATDANRMYRQPDHLDERTRMLHLARQVRDS